MSVTIGQLTEDLVPYTEKGNKVAKIEIVPRKIVEDIIAECDKARAKYLESDNISEFMTGEASFAGVILCKAYDLLSEFEGGE
ncbi:MAG: hypothetical protein IJ819_00240 [Clostridiales bacterium]|nr:hypothetical protein [Clostridiales bacterium]